MRISRWGAFSAALFLLSSCGDKVDDKVARGRPVTVFELRASAPPQDRPVMGLVEPFREEPVGFDVAGHVNFTLRAGADVQGPVFDETGEFVDDQRGEVIAMLDATRYQQALDAAALKLESARKGLDARKIEAQVLAPAEVEQAETQQAAAEQNVKASRSIFDLAQAELERFRSLLAGETVSQSEFDEVQTIFDEKQASLAASKDSLQGYAAGVAAAQAKRSLKEAQVEQTLAEISELENARSRSQQDLDDCVLRAPFTGRVMEELIGRGGYAAPGHGVLKLTMMTPIKVSITVSGEQSRRLIPGAQARLYPKDLLSLTGEESLLGIVDKKAEVADPATRTFRIDFLVRNVQRRRAEAEGGGGVPARMFPVLQYGEEGKLYVPTLCLSEQGDSVLKVPGLRLGSSRMADLGKVFETRLTPVQLADDYLSVLHLSLRRLEDGSDLKEFDMLVAQPGPEHEDGVVLDLKEWVLRPGDLVPVRFESTRGTEGFYVPVEAIRTMNGEASVYVVEGGRCRRVPVTLHEPSGGRRRIAGEGLADAVQIVKDGVHYVADGETVTVVKTPPWKTEAAARAGADR